MALSTYAIGTLGPNSTRLREVVVDATDEHEASVLARIERAMRGGYHPSAVAVSGVHRLVRPEPASAPDPADTLPDGALPAYKLLDDKTWDADFEPPTQLLPVVVTLVRQPTRLRAFTARRVLWLAAHVTWGRASWRLVRLAAWLIVPGDADARTAFLACALDGMRGR